MQLRVIGGAGEDAGNGVGCAAAPRPIVEGGLRLGGSDSGVVLLPRAGSDANAAVLIVERGTSGVLVDGFPPLPVAVLEAGSELFHAGECFVLEGNLRRTEIALRTEADAPGDCARCRRPLAVGDAVLCCAHCGVPRHEGLQAGPDGRELYCGSYDARCNRCNQLDPRGSEPGTSASHG